LEEIRQLLIERPSSFSVESTGPLLEEVGSGLSAVLASMTPNIGQGVEALERDEREDLRATLALAQRVGALYQQALLLYAPPY
jgi:hypothetical protein